MSERESQENSNSENNEYKLVQHSVYLGEQDPGIEENEFQLSAAVKIDPEQSTKINLGELEELKELKIWLSNQSKKMNEENEKFSNQMLELQTEFNSLISDMQLPENE